MRREERGRVFEDIFEVEAIGPCLVLQAWGHLLAGCLWIHFIDNAAALACMIRGSSTVSSGDLIVGTTWHQIHRHRVLAWFDRVESASNPVDGLSRGRAEGPWEAIEELHLPHQLQSLQG